MSFSNELPLEFLFCMVHALLSSGFLISQLWISWSYWLESVIDHFTVTSHLPLPVSSTFIAFRESSPLSLSTNFFSWFLSPTGDRDAMSSLDNLAIMKWNFISQWFGYSGLRKGCFCAGFSHVCHFNMTLCHLNSCMVSLCYSAHLFPLKISTTLLCSIIAP